MFLKVALITLIHELRKKINTQFEGHSLEIVFDSFQEPEHMKELGEFIEVELKSNISSKKGKSLLKKFLVSYGINYIETYPPYIELALNKEEYTKEIKRMNLTE